jgi:hypothetical protein
VVAVIARPEFVTDDNSALSGVLLNGPCALQYICRDQVKEGVVEDPLISINKIAFLLG